LEALAGQALALTLLELKQTVSWLSDDLPFWVKVAHKWGDLPQARNDAGVVFSGTSPNGRLVEVIELRDHPFFVGSQFHPEFRSRPNRPHPLFREFMRAAAERGNAIGEPAAIRGVELGIAEEAAGAG